MTGQDPTLTGNANPTAYEQLRADPIVRELSGSGPEAFELSIAEQPPLATRQLSDGRTLNLQYSIDASGQRYQVWGGQLADESTFAGAIMITKEDFDPAAPADDPRSWSVSLYVDRPGVIQLPAGDASKSKGTAFVGFALDKYGLQLSTDKDQMVTVLMRNSSETSDAAASAAVEVSAYAGATALTDLGSTNTAEFLPEVSGNETAPTAEQPAAAVEGSEETVVEDDIELGTTPEDEKINFKLTSAEIKNVEDLTARMRECFKLAGNQLVNREAADAALTEMVDRALETARAAGASKNLEMVIRGVAAGALTDRTRVWGMIEPIFAAGALPEASRAVLTTLISNMNGMRQQSAPESEKISEAYRSVDMTELNWPVRDEPTRAFLVAYRLGIHSQGQIDQQDYSHRLLQRLEGSPAR